MAIGKHGETIQAVEVNESSIVGVAANIGTVGAVVHLLADGDLTFHFDGGDKALTGLKAGMDFVAGNGCTGVTSTAAVIIS